MSFDPLEVAAGLEALIGRENVAAGYVGFRIALLGAQASVREAVARLPACPAVVPAGRQTRAVLDPQSLPWDCGLLEGLMEEVCTAAANWGRGSEELVRLRAAAAEQTGLLGQLARTAAFAPGEKMLESLGERLELSGEALLFSGRALAAPLVAAWLAAGVAGRTERQSPAAEPSGSCPLCGSTPGLASLERPQGRRVLFCSLCGHGWEFPRLECPFCGNQEKLGTLLLGEADPWSIETCERCRGYLKTADRRKLAADEPFIPLVQTTATLHLEMVAQREGYARGLPYVALL